jgi:hypothetical protein
MNTRVLGLSLALVGCDEELRVDCPSFENPSECGSQQGCAMFAAVEGQDAEGVCYHLCAPCASSCPPEPETCPAGLVCTELGTVSIEPEEVVGVFGICLPPGTQSPYE